jgi:hypothetical protein
MPAMMSGPAAGCSVVEVVIVASAECGVFLIGARARDRSIPE